MKENTTRTCSSEGMQADESLLTGESEPVAKRPGDELLSGSFIVAGSGRCEVTGVGAEAYARRLAAEARKFTLVRSDLMDGPNKILRYVTWAIIPVAAPLLIVSQVHAGAQGDLRRQCARSARSPRRPEFRFSGICLGTWNRNRARGRAAPIAERISGLSATARRRWSLAASGNNG